MNKRKNKNNANMIIIVVAKTKLQQFISVIIGHLNFSCYKYFITLVIIIIYYIRLELLFFL